MKLIRGRLDRANDIMTTITVPIINVDEETLLQAQVIKARGKLWTPALEKLLRQWRRQISTRQSGHIETGRIAARRNYIVGVPSVLLSAVAASGMFSSFQNCNQSLNLSIFSNSTEVIKEVASSNSNCITSVVVRVLAGVFAILTTIFSGLSMFLNYGATSEQHKNSADAYESLNRIIDEILQSPVTIRNDPIVEIQTIRRQYDDVAKGAPSLPAKYSVDLSYAYAGEQAKSQLLKPFLPPSPDEVEKHLSQRVDNISVLKEVIVDDGNDHESVVLPFDLDAVAPEDLTNIRSRQQLYPNLAKALAFEMQRLDRHGESRSDHSEKWNKKKVVSSQEGIAHHVDERQKERVSLSPDEASSTRGEKKDNV